MGEWLNVVVALAGLGAIVIPVLTGIRTRNPTRRRYWEREAQERLGSDGNWPKDKRLRGRAELALAYLDSDEAIRRVGVPGPAASWICGTICYLATVFFGIIAGRIVAQREQLLEQVRQAKTAEEAYSLKTEIAQLDSPTIWFVLAVIALIGAVVAYLDASTNPQRRNELQRVLVSLMSLPGGGAALESRPETFVNGWRDRKRRKRIKRSTKKMKDFGRCYEIWAEALFRECNDPSTKVLIQIASD